VTGDTQKRAALAEIVCRAGGREDIPIYAGLENPLLFGPGQPHVPQFEAVQDLPHRLDHSNDAITFMKDTIRARPHEITLLAVGPMTNIGALFAAYPDIPGILKNIVLMCGVYTGNAGHGPGAREWNADCDPCATALTYKYGAGKLLGVGLEVTTKCVVPAEECRQKFLQAGGALGIVGQMAEVWFKHAGQITFHDPLAATLIFQPEICTYATGTVTVVTEGSLAGLTQWQSRSETHAHQIAITVNPEQFFAHYFGVTI